MGGGCEVQHALGKRFSGILDDGLHALVGSGEGAVDGVLHRQADGGCCDGERHGGDDSEQQREVTQRPVAQLGEGEADHWVSLPSCMWRVVSPKPAADASWVIMRRV